MMKMITLEELKEYCENYPNIVISYVEGTERGRKAITQTAYLINRDEYHKRMKEKQRED